MMKFFKNLDTPALCGCGNLYAMPAKDFKVDETTYEEMTEIGYIPEDGATFRRTGETTPIMTANYGKIASFVSSYETEFETSTISLTKENMTVFTSGSEVVDNDDGTYTIYGCEDDTPANLALCFRGVDKEGTLYELYMPNAVYVPEWEMVFDAENPVALSLLFTCNNTSLGNGRIGSYYIRTNIDSKAKTE